jgi:hypothetical protein
MAWAGCARYCGREGENGIHNEKDPWINDLGSNSGCYFEVRMLEKR